MKTLFFVCLFLFGHTSIFGSTSFVVEGTQSAAVAKSYDWKMGHGMLIVNKRNVHKKSLIRENSKDPFSWISLYGSVTFNQYGTELPSGGMNEQGLIIEQIHLEESIYPPLNDTDYLNELQWIQYQLDNYKTTQEVLSHLDSIKIKPLFGSKHYLVCDMTSECIAIEYLNGQSFIHSSVNVLTESRYKLSLDHLTHFVGFGGTLPIPSDNSSLSRFVRVSDALKHFRRGHRNNVIETSFTMLNSVRNGLKNSDLTVWNIVYDLENMKIHFVHTLVGLKKSIDLNSLDFACMGGRKIYNIESHQGSGRINDELIKYKTSFNQRIVQLSLTDSDDSIPSSFVEKIINFPDTFSCQEKAYL